MGTTGEDVFCEIELSSREDLVGTVTDFVVGISTRVLADKDLCGRLEVTTHELVDNAVRYAREGGRSSVAVRMRRVADELCVSIETKNRASEPKRAELAQLFDEMHQATSRDAFYQTLLRRAARRGEGSGLGLGRIHAEADMNLRYEVDGDLVRLHAEACIPSPPELK